MASSLIRGFGKMKSRDNGHSGRSVERVPRNHVPPPSESCDLPFLSICVCSGPRHPSQQPWCEWHPVSMQVCVTRPAQRWNPWPRARVHLSKLILRIVTCQSQQSRARSKSQQKLLCFRLKGDAEINWRGRPAVLLIETVPCHLALPLENFLGKPQGLARPKPDQVG